MRTTRKQTILAPSTPWGAAEYLRRLADAVDASRFIVDIERVELTITADDDIHGDDDPEAINIRLLDAEG